MTGTSVICQCLLRLKLKLVDCALPKTLQPKDLFLFVYFRLQNLFILIPIKLEKSNPVFLHHFGMSSRKKNVMKVFVTFSEALQSMNMLDPAFSRAGRFHKSLGKNDLTSKYGISEVYSEPCQTFNMSFFVKMFNSFQLLFIFAKSSIFHV